jgi:thymidylate kinase
VLERRQARGLFSIPHPTHEAVLNLITRLIYHGGVREKYKSGILENVKQDSAGTAAVLADTFGRRVAQALVQGILAGNWKGVEQQAGAMRRQIIWRQITRQPLGALGSWLHDLGRFARRLWHPPGMLVVLLGADGSGKSSAGAQLVEALRGTFHPEKMLHGHWKPALIRRRGRNAPAIVTDPHGRLPRGKPASLLVLACHWLEFFVGGAVQFVPVLFRNGLVLMDRYHYDFAVDPRRYRLQVSARTVRALFRWLPEPDLVFVLDAPPEVLRARKQEVPVEETRRQREAYRKLAESLPNARIVDCARPLDAVVGDMTGHVLRCLRDRQARRMKR